MAVRNLTILKFAALLIFAFELLAPVVLFSNGNEGPCDGSGIKITHANHGNFNLFASLVFEEAGSEEEREGKDHKALSLFTGFNFVAELQLLAQRFALNLPKNFYMRVHSGSTQLPFIRVFRI